MTTFALTPYPLSRRFAEGLEELAGEHVDVVLLAELRRLGPAALVRRLRTLRGRCLLPLEDGNSEGLLAILELVAAASRATSIETVDTAMVRKRVSRVHAAISPALLLGSSLDAQRALVQNRHAVTHLLQTPPSTLAAGPERRILYLNGNLWFGLKAGGSIAHTSRVANALARAGYEVELATLSPPSDLDHGVLPIQLHPPRHFGLPPEANVYRWNRSLPGQLEAARIPSFVYQRHSIGSFTGAELSQRLKRPLVLEYNGSEVWVARNWGRPLRYEDLARKAEEASLRHAALVVTVSAVLRDELLSRGVPQDRIVFHPNGVDPEIFDPARFDASTSRALRAVHGIPVDAVVATFVGTFGQWHGAEVFARAIVMLAERYPDELAQSKLHFLFVGDGLKLSEVRRLLGGHEDISTLAGLVPQADVPPYFALSDICVAPTIRNSDGSRFFGSPTKVFEYMAAGKPIIASDIDQVGDVLRGDGTPLGILVEPGDPPALAEALLHLAGSPTDRNRLGEAARQAVVARYTWRHHVQAILESVAALP